MIRQLVVGIDGSEHSLTACRYAECLASRHRGELKVVFAVDSRKTELPLIYTTGPFEYSFTRAYLPPDTELESSYGRIRESMNAFADSCLAECQERCSRQGLAVLTLKREGLPSRVLTEEVRSGDLLVIGQKGENARFERTIVGSTTEDVVRSSPRPVLVCPGQFREPRNLLFPYDGSEAAERALQFCVNAFGNTWDELVFLLAGQEAVDGEVVKREEAYLDKHGIRHRIVQESGLLVDGALETAGKESSDIILVGAYGRHKIREYLLGSTASHLIRKSHLPVLVVY
jgi:nucleotide-binding universal stress UspA family protein